MQRLLLIGLLLSLLAVGCSQDQAAGGASTPLPPVTATTAGIGVSLATRAAPTVAVVQTTPTPLPTATPTPTATPILYAIVSGDTLLDIAIQRRTTVAEIEALNPGIQANLLQIGQQIVLPPPATAVAQGVAGTAVPIQVRVVSLTTLETPVGGLWLLGEVANDGTLPVANVRVSMQLPVGDDVLVLDAWTAGAVIPPGSRAPFGVLLPERPAVSGQPTVVVSAGESVLDLGTQLLDVAVVTAETAVIMTDDRVEVSGTVVNQSDQAADGVVVAATFYDASGQVAGFYQHALTGVVAAGEKRPFTFTAAPPGGPVATLSWLVNARRAGNDSTND